MRLAVKVLVETMSDPGVEIGAGDRLRHLGLGQREDVVIALLVVAQPEIAGIIGLGELPVLDLGAERAVGDQDALGGFARAVVRRRKRSCRPVSSAAVAAGAHAPADGRSRSSARRG